MPVNIGTDAALALAMAQVVVREGLYRKEFVREQTDFPLLVRVDNGKLLREKDFKRDGREDVFYVYDEASRQIVEAPRQSLTLGKLVPALEGEYTVQVLSGTVQVRPVFEFLRERLDKNFTPEKAAQITSVPVSLIEKLARDVAGAGGVVNISTSNWGKFYHGDLIERAIFLVFVLCGHMGRKGATFSAFPALTPDTALGALERHGHQMLLSASGSDPRYAAWKEDGYTTEMILYEYSKQAVAAGSVGLTAMVHFVHGGLVELAERHRGWDPYLKRRLGEYVDEALDKSWQVVVPPRHKEPRILFQVGGNVFRRGRGNYLPGGAFRVRIKWRWGQERVSPRQSMIDKAPMRRSRTKSPSLDEARLRQQAIGVRLRQMFDEVVNEPVPDEFLQILRKHDEEHPGEG